MRLTPENKQKITNRIRAGAAKVFRKRGFDAVNLDQLMKEAGLTRGAFYAHYPSKKALLTDVMRHEHPLLHLLKRRDGRDAIELHQQMVDVFAGYLDPEHLDEVFNGCTLAALTGDATRAPRDVKMALAAAFDEICREMARDQDLDANAFVPALILASGAVRTAQAIGDIELRSNILRAARQSFLEILPKPTAD